MALQHAALTAPTGVTITGVYFHEKRTRTQDVNIEALDSDGTFADGKSLRKETTISIRGECETAAALPTPGVGLNTSASPHVESVEETEKNDGVKAFAVECKYAADGAGAYAAEA